MKQTLSENSPVPVETAPLLNDEQERFLRNNNLTMARTIYGDGWEDTKEAWQTANPGKKGMKFSSGKPRWQLMNDLWPAMTQVVTVLTRGAEKYEDDNWKHVDRSEYMRAIMSHFSAYASGELIDADMGTNHMANLICSALFLLWHDGIRREEE